MNKKENRKNVDMEAKMFMFVLHLKEEKNKKYSIGKCETNVAYLFDDYNEFKTYFEVNGCVNLDKDLLELCRIKTTRKGTIIALKGLCDYVIKKYDLNDPDKGSEHTITDTFIVLQEKLEKLEFKLEIKQLMDATIEKFRVNELEEKEQTLKKIKKFNR